MAAVEEVDVMAEHSYGGGESTGNTGGEEGQVATTVTAAPELGEESTGAINSEAEPQQSADPASEVNPSDPLENSEITEEEIVTDELESSEITEEDVTDSTDEVVIVIQDGIASANHYTEICSREEGEKIKEIFTLPEASDTEYSINIRTGKAKGRVQKTNDVLKVFPFVCGICSAKFDKIRKFYAHFKIHREYQSALHICTTETAGSDGDESETEMFSCGICEADFPSMCLLHDHMVTEEMIADYRYYNHVVLPVYGRVVHSKNLVNKDDDKEEKSEESQESPTKPKRRRGRPRKSSVVKKEPEVDDDDDDVKLDKKKGKDDEDYEPEETRFDEKATKATSSPRSYGTRRQSAIESSKSETTTSVKKGKLIDEKSKNKTPVQIKTPCITSYNRSNLNQEVLKKNYEMSTRKKTYKLLEESEIKKEPGVERIKNKRRKLDLSTDEENQVSTNEIPDDEIIADQTSKEGMEEETEIDPIQENSGTNKEQITIEENSGTNPEQIPIKEKSGTNQEHIPIKKKSGATHEQIELMAVEHDEEDEMLSETEKAERRKTSWKERRNKLVTCKECGKVLPRRGLARHRVVHMDSRNYECQVCGKTFKSQSHLTDHKRVVHADRCHKCTTCYKSFKTRQALDKHHNLHLRKGETKVEELVDPTPEQLKAAGRVICEQCGKSVLKTSMRKHIQGHSTVRNYKCDICNRAFKQANHVLEHMNVVHLKIKKYKCEFCEQLFKSNRTLWTHRNTHLNPKDPHHSDVVVSKLQREQKDKDLRAKHAMPKTVTCDDCGKTVLQKRLNRHKSIHRKTKDFACDMCNKRFITQRYVNDHKLKVHTPHRQFCDICGQFFKGKGYLEKHRQIHGPRDKECEICGKTFTTDFYLRLHRQTHTDRKAFKCEQCPAAFSHKKRLSEHMNEKHNVGDKKPCKYCFQMFPSRKKARFHERRVHEGLDMKKTPSKKKKPFIKHEPISIGEEYHVIVRNDMSSDSQDPHIKILTEKMNNESEEVELVEMIDASEGIEDGEMTHQQLLDAVIQSGSQTETQTVQIENGTEIVQHVLEIPETADRICALVMYPDGSYRLVNPDEVGPDVKIVAEVATG